MPAKVDIAIPCHNYGRFLPDCVASVLGQGIAEVRLLIIDNASTDDSLDIARTLAAQDTRISVSAHASNRGPHASFNEGVDWASAASDARSRMVLAGTEPQRWRETIRSGSGPEDTTAASC